ncbi:hypothetical protein ACLB1N_34280 [Escherichia coli]
MSTLPTQQATTDIKLKDNGGDDGKGRKGRKTSQKDPAEEALKRKRANWNDLTRASRMAAKRPKCGMPSRRWALMQRQNRLSEMKNLAHLIYETNAAREHQSNWKTKPNSLTSNLTPLTLSNNATPWKCSRPMSYSTNR